MKYLDRMGREGECMQGEVRDEKERASQEFSKSCQQPNELKFYTKVFYLIKGYNKAFVLNFNISSSNRSLTKTKLLNH